MRRVRNNDPACASAFWLRCADVKFGMSSITDSAHAHKISACCFQCLDMMCATQRNPALTATTPSRASANVHACTACNHECGVPTYLCNTPHLQAPSAPKSMICTLLQHIICGPGLRYNGGDPGPAFHETKNLSKVPETLSRCLSGRSTPAEERRGKDNAPGKRKHKSGQRKDRDNTKGGARTRLDKVNDATTHRTGHRTMTGQPKSSPKWTCPVRRHRTPHGLS